MRRLAAALACRVRSSQLYGKPRQNLAPGVTILDHPERFRIAIDTPPPAMRRLDRRLTVDYPEDLVPCRRVYEALAAKALRIPIDAIVELLGTHPALTAPYVDPMPLWGAAAAPA